MRSIDNPRGDVVGTKKIQRALHVGNPTEARARRCSRIALDRAPTSTGSDAISEWIGTEQSTTTIAVVGRTREDLFVRG